MRWRCVGLGSKNAVVGRAHWISRALPYQGRRCRCFREAPPLPCWTGRGFSGQGRRALFNPEGNALASPDLQASLRQHQAANLDAAIAGYRAFLQQQPDHAEAHRLLGLALFARGEVAPARAALEHAVSLAPANAALLNDLGNARRAAGEKAAAIEAFIAAIAAHPALALPI
ncbi:MAG: tetratricopeptide repeat protein, partial [Alphaproteobacteria bacterium]|nr:tetratricopeptide repeat protein [Alphaproteobacteria bacterium]